MIMSRMLNVENENGEERAEKTRKGKERKRCNVVLDEMR